jgi:hypothetical protein
MARQRRSGSIPKDDYGGYSAAQVDAALVDTLRSDWPSILLRVAVVAIVYTLLARAVLEGMSSPYLILPLLAEVLLIFWLGWLLTRTVVDCPNFRKSAGSFGITLFWTVGIGAVVFAALAFDRQQEVLDPAQVLPRMQRMGAVIQHHQLHWALAAMLLGLVVSTAMDISRWRANGGAFFWASITHAGFRMGLLVVAIPLLGVPLLIFAESVFGAADQTDSQGWLTAQLGAWPVWGLLLVLEIAAVAVGVLIHRELLAKGEGRESAWRDAAGRADEVARPPHGRAPRRR